MQNCNITNKSKNRIYQNIVIKKNEKRIKNIITIANTE